MKQRKNMFNLTSEKTVIVLNMVEAGLWRDSSTYRDEIKQLATLASDTGFYDIRDTYGVLLFSHLNKQ